LRLATKLSRAILIVLVLCILMTISAGADTTGFSFALNSSGDGYIVSSYNGSDAAVVVPDWYNGKPVTEIGSSAFKGNTAITSVSLPSSIRRLGASAFANCSNISKFTAYTAADEPPKPAVVPGDADGDGGVDIQDVLRMLQYSAGWRVSVNQMNADMNGDDSVSIIDVVRLLQYYMDQDVTLQ